jgi:hypothetical protein
MASLLDDVSLVDVNNEQTTSVIVVSTHHNKWANPPETLKHTIGDWMQGLHQADKWSVEYLKVTDEGENIATAITAGKARAVSDGSFKDGRATSAFTIHGDNPTRAVTGCNRLVVHNRDMTPYRAE